ncbi:uncharacterized protein LOC62_03G003798 [Vanrija pseudolonga]|uniref:Uncharacterized protein n=1 Tax=Vanrija pseudolonga TaxID=143232 RepID=A0AAF0Y8W0_9TREE|nr:hypothetical protein LOC62_03G003798 [Vanrija pseudolonga]
MHCISLCLFVLYSSSTTTTTTTTSTPNEHERYAPGDQKAAIALLPSHHRTSTPPSPPTYTSRTRPPLTFVPACTSSHCPSVQLAPPRSHLQPITSSTTPSPLGTHPPTHPPITLMPVTVATPTVPISRTVRSPPSSRSRSPSPLRESKVPNTIPEVPAPKPKAAAAAAVKVAPASAAAHAPAPPHAGCRGFILASQYAVYAPEGTHAPDHISSAGDSAFELIPCPRAPSAPGHPGTSCAPPPPGIERRDSACSNGGFCDRHWCGGCKRAERAWAAYEKKVT